MTDIEQRRDTGAEVAVPADTSYEVAIDAEPDAVPVAVDPPAAVATRLPVVPHHLRTRAGVRRAVARQAASAGHRSAYHGLRSPRYLLAAVVWAVVGAGRLFGRWLHWWLAPVPLAAHTDAAGEGWRAWRTVHTEHKRTAKTRAWISLAVLVPAAVAVTLAVALLPWWWFIPAAVALLPLLARAGRPEDRRIIRPATVTPRFRKLSADVVLRAYYAAGLGDADKTGQQITFGGPMSRDGDGSRVLVDLPYGKGLDDAVKAKARIASGLDVQTSQVFLHRDPTSHRRHVLWVADRDPLAVPVGRTPLLNGKATDIWKPAALGLDERGQLVTVPLMWHSVLVSALPRAGKTFSARLLALHAALDPHVKLSVFDAKGSPDWRKFALIAHSCAFGLTPTRHGLPGDILLAELEDIRRDVEDRYHRLSAMPASVCPEGKLTREIARDPRYEMPVRVLVLEEFQEYYDMGEASKNIASLLTFLVKVAPGAGVIIIGATQRPSGVGTGQVAQQFVSFRDNFAVRFGLRTSSWQVSELCLGAGAYSEGLDTSTLLPQYRGVGILRGASDASPTVRTYLADGGDAERILTAARRHREAAGTLTGMAAGEDAPEPSRDVVGDVLGVLGNDPAAHWTVLAARLAAQLPGRWEGATAESVSAACRAAGVRSVDVKQFGTVRKGCRRADLDAATG